MTIRWIEPPAVEVPPELCHALGGHRLVAELLYRRGIRTPDEALAFLDPRHYAPAPSASFPDMERAIERLVRAIQNQERILVWGDFDVDGQTATAILVSVLEMSGANVRFYIPHRQEESHGLNQATLEEQIDQGVDVLITCDCGVGDVAEVAFVQGRGVDVIVTDHHDLPAQPAPALALVNPKRLPPDHPGYSLAGAGVAYKVAEALLAHFGRGRLAEGLTDLAALGTIADVAPLVRDNRYLVQLGMPRLAAGRRAGLRALFAVGGFALSEMDTTPVMFELAPALNAVGRLADAELAVKLLLTEDKRSAEKWAVEILGLNEERRYQTQLALDIALEKIEGMERPLPPVLVLDSRAWHSGVIGIVAGRLVSLYHRPAVVISVEEGGLARGSARSVPGIDIHEAITGVEDLLVSQGGHPMAAGFVLPEKNIPEFRSRLTQIIRASAPRELLEQEVQIDAWVEWPDVSLALYDDLARLAPFGEGNPAPVLASRRLSLVSMEMVGARQDHCRLRFADDNGVTRDVMWFNGSGDLLPKSTLDIAFVLRPNLYAGARRLQVELVAFRRTPPEPLEILFEQQVVRLLDFRREEDREGILMGWARRAASGESLALWGEGKGAEEYGFLRRRDQLGPAKALVVWTVPPGPEEFRQVLSRVKPEHVVLLFGDRPHYTLRDLMADLMGLIKFTLKKKQGEANLETFAGVLGVRTNMVLLGLEMLQELDVCLFDRIGGTGLFFFRYRPQSMRWENVQRTTQFRALEHLIEEMDAYREFLTNAPPEEVLPAGIDIARNTSAAKV